MSQSILSRRSLAAFHPPLPYRITLSSISKLPNGQDRELLGKGTIIGVTNSFTYSTIDSMLIDSEVLHMDKGAEGNGETPVGLAGQVRPRKALSLRRLSARPTESESFPAAP
ncbi:hypothetical protein SAMN04487936_105151 [Halobacillus dabanensis]|uniref:Uncharacterized protein n=1 Tax=Halobacillus dabanensis TaxID=240302 RepID=A0A1I3V6M4_HALDA|nr:hypothetical protein SAMN04487936_105151 [Halobacillus dabanensis]